MANGGVDEAVRRGHLLEAGVVDDQIRPQDIEQRKEIGSPQLNRRGAEKHNRVRVVAEVANSLVQLGLGVPDMVRLIDDDQIKLGWRVEFDQPQVLLARLVGTEDQVLVEQRKRDDRLRILIGPFALQVRLLQAVPQ